MSCGSGAFSPISAKVSLYASSMLVPENSSATSEARTYFDATKETEAS
jgi:hypothetical protein